MRKTYILLLVILIASFTHSCKKSTIALDQEPLLGTWVEEKWTDGVLELEKANKLHKDKYGFTLQSDGKLIEHKNSGWCGTPPISYADFEGTWHVISDDSLAIEVDFWGGIQNFHLKILQVSNEKMKVKYYYQ